MPKVTKRLTNQEILNSKPAKKPYRLYDDERLRILVRPSGKKVWQLPYTFRKKHNTYTIGEYAPNKSNHIGLKEARKAVHDIQELIDQGIDPNKQKQLERLRTEHQSLTTLEGVAREWHSKGPWVEGHAKRIIRSLEKDVFPLIGYKQINDVTALDISLVLSEIEKRETYDTAKRVCQRCSCIFDYAIFKGICDNNPATGRSKFIKTQKTEHRPHLQAEEIPEFLERLEEYRGRNYIGLGIKLLLLTFVRPGELRCAPWSEIDWDNALWKIPSERMKMKRDHVVPLSKQALEALEELHAITGNSQYLFPGVQSIHKPISDATFIKALKVMGYTGDKKITPHGFRHTASTILNEQGFNSDWIERQLAHSPRNKIRGIYNKAEYLDGRKEMMQWWANYLDNIAQNSAVIFGKFRKNV